MKEELFDFLNADVPITALVGDRIYIIQAPTSADLPRITITRITNGHEHHLLGAAGLSRAVYQIDSWGRNGPEVTSVSEAIRTAMDGFIDKDMGAVNVRGAFLEAETDSIEPPVDASQNAIFRVSQDWAISHVESIPTP